MLYRISYPYQTGGGVIEPSKLAHQFWLGWGSGSGSCRAQTDEEKKEKKEMAEAAARHELYTQQQWAHQRAERAERNAERLEREIQAQAASAAASESLAELHYVDSLSGSVQSM